MAGLSDDDLRSIEILAAAAPPLDDEQVRGLKAILGPARQARLAAEAAAAAKHADAEPSRAA